MNTTHFHAEERVSIGGQWSDWQNIADNASVIYTESQAVQLAAAGLELARCKYNAGVTKHPDFNPDEHLVNYTSDETVDTDKDIVYFAQFKRPNDPDFPDAPDDYFQVRVQSCDGEVIRGGQLFEFSLDDLDDEESFGAVLSAILGGLGDEPRGLSFPTLPAGKLAA